MSETSAAIRNLDDYVASLQECAREEAKQLAFLAEFATPDDNESGEYSSREIAAVSRLNPQFVRDRIELAHTLATRLPEAMAALRAGVMDERPTEPIADPENGVRRAVGRRR